MGKLELELEFESVMGVEPTVLEEGNPEMLLPIMVPEGRPVMEAMGVGAMVVCSQAEERIGEVRSSPLRDWFGTTALHVRGREWLMRMRKS